MTIGGTAAQLHKAWNVCLNVSDHLYAVAPKTRKMVDAAHAANPACETMTSSSKSAAEGSSANASTAVNADAAPVKRYALFTASCLI